MTVKTLSFSGRITSLDKEPFDFDEKIKIADAEVIFKTYPLSLLKVRLDSNGVLIDGIKYTWENLPVTIHKVGKHCTKYRDIVEENIEITIECIETESDMEEYI